MLVTFVRVGAEQRKEEQFLGWAYKLEFFKIPSVLKKNTELIWPLVSRLRLPQPRLSSWKIASQLLCSMPRLVGLKLTDNIFVNLESFL